MYAIVANVKSDRCLRAGAKVFICSCNGDAERPVVFGMSKSGRRIQKYTTFKRLENYRPCWIPDSLISRIALTFESKEKASEHAMSLQTIWTGVRYFSPGGSELLQAGISVGQAFRKVE